MAKTRSMTRNESHDDAPQQKRIKTCENSGATGLNHDVLFLVMMKLGVIDFVSFSGVCKSWRSAALCNRKRFMATKPPMPIYISYDINKKECYCRLEDFEGRTFKTLILYSAGRKCFGLTCGYLILFGGCTRDFWLVNPITRHQLHFPDFPYNADKLSKAILVYSPSIHGWVFVVIRRFGKQIWFSIAGKGAWNDVSCGFPISDLVAFKGKIYILHIHGHLSEFRLNPKPKLSILEIKNFERDIYLQEFVTCGENLYVIYNNRHPRILYEIDFGEMKRASPEEKRIGECVFFLNFWNHGVAFKSESWDVDPRSECKYYDCFRDTTGETQKGRFFHAQMWYFPHRFLDVDPID